MEHIKDYKLFKESLDTELLTEKYSSDILRQFAAQDGGSRWRGGIAKDMQKFANLALDKISDADFTTTTPEAYWKGGDAKNPNKVGFFVDADPGFIKWAKANKKYLPGGLSIGNISKSNSDASWKAPLWNLFNLLPSDLCPSGKITTEYPSFVCFLTILSIKLYFLIKSLISFNKLVKYDSKSFSRSSFIQIFNKNDPCCYSGIGYESYEFFIKDKLVELGKGSFQILIDDTHNEHKISDTMLEYIRKNIGWFFSYFMLSF